MSERSPRTRTQHTRARIAIWLLVACGAALGAVIAMVLVHVLMGGTIGLGL